MSLPVPSQRTWSVGNIVTAAEMNANVRDAVNFLSAVPIAMIYQSSSQSIPSANGTAITFDAEQVDTYGGHSNTSNNARYTCQAAGYYAVLGQSFFPSNSTGYRRLDIYLNGNALTPQNQAISGAVSGAGTAVNVIGLVQASVGDYLTIIATQNSGGALSLPGGGASSMMLWWIHS